MFFNKSSLSDKPFAFVYDFFNIEFLGIEIPLVMTRGSGALIFPQI